jgi:hypothetical protein
MPGGVQGRESVPMGGGGTEEGQDVGAGGGGEVPVAGTPLRQQQVRHSRYRSGVLSPGVEPMKKVPQQLPSQDATPGVESIVWVSQQVPFWGDNPVVELIGWVAQQVASSMGENLEFSVYGCKCQV